MWSRVYFYAIIGTVASVAFFASPAKVWLAERLKKRNHPSLQRTASQETIGQPLMGLPNDPIKDIDEAIEGIREEVQARKRRGASINMPAGQDLKVAVEQKLGRKV